MKSFPELFDHYFTYWADKDNWHQTLNKEGVANKLNLISEKLPHIENQFKEKGRSCP